MDAARLAAKNATRGFGAMIARREPARTPIAVAALGLLLAGAAARHQRRSRSTAAITDRTAPAQRTARDVRA